MAYPMSSFPAPPVLVDEVTVTVDPPDEVTVVNAAVEAAAGLAEEPDELAVLVL